MRRRTLAKQTWKGSHPHAWMPPAPPPTIPTTRDQPPLPNSVLCPHWGWLLWQPKPPSRRRPSHASLMNGFIPHLRSASKDPPAPRRRLSKLFALPHRALPRTAPFGDTYSTYHPSISGGASPLGTTLRFRPWGLSRARACSLPQCTPHRVRATGSKSLGSSSFTNHSTNEARRCGYCSHIKPAVPLPNAEVTALRPS